MSHLQGRGESVAGVGAGKRGGGQSQKKDTGAAGAHVKLTPANNSYQASPVHPASAQNPTLGHSSPPPSPFTPPSATGPGHPECSPGRRSGNM